MNTAKSCPFPPLAGQSGPQLLVPAYLCYVSILNTQRTTTARRKEPHHSPLRSHRVRGTAQVKCGGSVTQDTAALAQTSAFRGESPGSKHLLMM